MYSEVFEKKAKTYSLTPFIMTFAFSATVVVLAIALTVNKSTGTPSTLPLEVFYLVAAAIAFIFFFCRKKFLSEEAFLTSMKNSSVEGEEGMSVVERRCLRAFERRYFPFIICLTLAETIGILGFVYAFLKQDIAFFIPFGAVAIVLILINKPVSVEKLKEYCELYTRNYGAN